MSFSEYAFVWLVDMSVATAIVLGIGGAAIAAATEPATRQRIGEITLAAAILVSALLAIPGVNRLELGIVDLRSRDVVARQVAGTRTIVKSGGLLPTRELPPVAADSDASTLAQKPESAGSATESVEGTVIVGPASAVAFPAQPARTNRSRPALQSPSALSVWRTWLLGTYFGGSALAMSWLLLGAISLARLRHTASQPSREILALWQQVGNGHPSRAKLLVSTKSAWPITFGLLRPVVLIPAAMCAPDHRRRLWYVLQHEHAHVERHDAISWILTNVVRAIVFPQPVYWWIRRQIRLSQEFIADSRAAQSGLSVADYAQMLVDLSVHQGYRPHACQAVGAFRSRSDLYRRIQVLSRANLVPTKRCSTSFNVRMGSAAMLSVLVLSLLTLRAGAQVDSHEADRSSETLGEPSGEVAESRSWYILRQPNSMGHFHGLPQRMEAYSTAKVRKGAIWEGDPDGGSMELQLDIESDSTNPVFIGFFPDPRWWKAPPVQVRRFDRPGRYLVRGLPPGTYYVGATLGSLPRPDALGVASNWPGGIDVKAGTVSRAHVLVSDDFKWHDRAQNPRDYVGDLPELNPARLVTVRSVEQDGTPVPYCLATFRFTAKNGFVTISNSGTTHEGMLLRGDIDGEFRLSLQRSSFDPGTLGVRHRFLQSPEPFDAADLPVIEVEWPPIDTGSGVVSGQVHDQRGKPLTEFQVELMRGQLGSDDDDESSTNVEFVTQRIPFMSPDGRYTIDGLGSGDYRITAYAFDYPTHVYQKQDEYRAFSITDDATDAVEMDIELDARELRYGRAMFEDGTLVKNGSWLSSARGSYSFESAGLFRVSLSTAERDRLMERHDGKLSVHARGANGTRSTAEVAWEDLSSDAAKPFTVVVPDLPRSPEPKTAQQEPESPDDPDAVLRLKQLGAMVKTRANGTVEQLKFLEARFRDADAALLKRLPNLASVSFVRTKVGDGTLAQLSGHPTLQELHLRGSEITDAGLRHVSAAASLQLIDLSSTRITDDGLAALADLDQLESINLANTNVGDAGLEHFVNCRNLKKMDLRMTSVTAAGLASVAKFPQLEDLNLSGLPITDDRLSQIGQLVSLKRLDLGRTRVSDAGLEHLSGLQSLTDLDLFDTEITDAGVAVITQHSGLERLRLSRTKVTDVCVNHLAALEQLRILYAEPNITDRALPQLAAFPNLEVLSVGSPNVTDAGMEHIGQMQKLTNLFLENADITDASIPHLARLRNLLLLDIRNTRITSEGKRKFFEEFGRPSPQMFGP